MVVFDRGTWFTFDVSLNLLIVYFCHRVSIDGREYQQFLRHMNEHAKIIVVVFVSWDFPCFGFRCFYWTINKWNFAKQAQAIFQLDIFSYEQLIVTVKCHFGAQNWFSLLCLKNYINQTRDDNLHHIIVYAVRYSNIMGTLLS